MTQSGGLRVHRANFYRRIGRMCFEGPAPALPAPHAITFFEFGAARLEFDAIADAELWVDRHEMAEVLPATRRRAYFAMVQIDGVLVEFVVWADADAEVHEIRTKQMPGGPIRVWCSCRQWSGVAPSWQVAERDAAAHKAQAVKQ